MKLFGRFFKVPTLNSTVTNLKLFKGNLSSEVTNLLSEDLGVSSILLVLRQQIHLLRPSEEAPLFLPFNSFCCEGAIVFPETLSILC